jgi:hypothetical protein
MSWDFKLMRQRILVKELELSTIQKDILIGYVLSDGCLYPLPNSAKASLKIEHSLKQKEFVDWLYQNLKDFVRTPPGERSHLYSNSKGSFRKNSFYFNTRSFNVFYTFYNLFYKNKRKIIPDNIEELLTPLSLAVWFMGDGSVKSHECNGRIFNTHGYTELEVIKLVEILKRKFSLIASVRRQKDGLQIYISAKSAIIFNDLIAKFVLPSFYYKLPRFKN